MISNRKPEGDFRVLNCGTVLGFAPISDAGRAWWHMHVQQYAPWQERGGFVWIDHRPAYDIIAGLVDDGLSVRSI